MSRSPCIVASADRLSADFSVIATRASPCRVLRIHPSVRLGVRVLQEQGKTDVLFSWLKPCGFCSPNKPIVDGQLTCNFREISNSVFATQAPRQRWAYIGQRWANVGQCQTMLGQCWTMLGQCQTTSSNIDPICLCAGWIQYMFLS